MEREGGGYVRKPQEIKVVAYVHVGDKLVNVDDLDAEMRRRLATALKTTYLNELFRGEAVFWPKGENKPGT